MYEIFAVGELFTIDYVFGCRAYLYELYVYAEHTPSICMLKLSIRCQFVRLYSAYALNLYPYSQHTQSICTRLLSIRRFWNKNISNLYTYAQHTSWNCTRMISIRNQFVPLCSAYAVNLYSYAQHKLTNVNHKNLNKVRKKTRLRKILFDPLEGTLKESRFSFYVCLAL